MESNHAPRKGVTYLGAVERVQQPLRVIHDDGVLSTGPPRKKGRKIRRDNTNKAPGTLMTLAVPVMPS